MSASDSEAGAAMKGLWVDAAEAGVRLDRWLAARLAPQLSRSRIQALIRNGKVTIDGRTASEPSRPMIAGETAAVEIPAQTPAEPAAEPLPLDILFEDDDVIVVNKPAGLVVHPGAGNRNGTLVNALVARCGTV